MIGLHLQGAYPMVVLSAILGEVLEGVDVIVSALRSFIKEA